MAGKYLPLEKYLTGLPTNIHELTLSFEQIERIIKNKLPKSAQEYNAWWANEVNGSHVEAKAWMDAGWKVENVDFERLIVRFVKIR